MCFTPTVSIITALIEFAAAAYLFCKIKDKRLYPAAILVLLLGFYQLTEFMLCTSANALVWARLGFAAYTFMPLLICHFFINLSGKKIALYWYLVPSSFAGLALWYPNFINYTSCNALNVTVESLIFNQNAVLMSLYLLYYLISPVYGVYVFSKKEGYKHRNLQTRLGMAAAPLALLAALLYYFWSAVYERSQAQTWLTTSVIIMVALLMLLLLSSFLYRKSARLFYLTNAWILATTGVTVVLLYYVIPDLTLNYSSIFCQFAVLYAVASVLLINSLGGKVPD